MLEKGQRLYTGIGAFEVIEHLGRGKTADVWHAVNSRNPDESVAIKYARVGMESLVKTNFENEARVLRAFEDIEAGSGHFPIFLNQGKHEGRTPYVIMSLISAEPIVRRAFSQPERRLSGSLGLEQEAINAALSYANMLVIVHQAGYAAIDRKLEDIHWDSVNQKITVLDWNVVGTGEIAQKNDLYQFGEFWYRLMMGTLPPGPGQSLEGRKGWDRLTYGTKKILTRALHPSRNARFQSAEELKDALTRLAKFLNLSTPELEKGALQIVEQNPDEAYLMLDIIEIHHAVDISSKAHEEWLELDRQKRGAWETLIAQGIGSLRREEFTIAASDFSQAMVHAGDNPERRLQTFRWRLLAEGLQAQKFVDPTDTSQSIELVTALNNGTWDKVHDGEDTLAGMRGEALNDLRADLDIMLRTVEADKALEMRDYQVAHDQLQQALSTLQDRPVIQRDILANAGWQMEQIEERAHACLLLARTEGAASNHLLRANRALDEHLLKEAAEELDAGLGLAYSRHIIKARPELADRKPFLQPPLDEDFYTALHRFYLHQLADQNIMPERGKRLQALRELEKEFKDDPWAKEENQSARAAILSDLRHFDIEVRDQPALLANQFYQDDEEVQDALGALRESARANLKSLMESHASFIENVAKTEPIAPLLKAGERRISWAEQQIDQTQRLSPSLFSTSDIEGYKEQISNLRPKLDAAQAEFADLKGKAESKGISFDVQGDGLDAHDKALVDALLQEEHQAWEKVKNLAENNKEALSKAYLQAAEEMLNLYSIQSANRYYDQILQATWSTPAAKNMAQDALIRLEELDIQRQAGEKKINQAQDLIEDAFNEQGNSQARIDKLKLAQSRLKEIENIDFLKARTQAIQNDIEEMLAKEQSQLMRKKIEAIGVPQEDIVVHNVQSVERYIKQSLGILAGYEEVAAEFPSLEEEIEKRVQNIRRDVKLLCVDQPLRHVQSKIAVPDEQTPWKYLSDYVNSYQGLLPLISSALTLEDEKVLGRQFEMMCILFYKQQIGYLNQEINQALIEEPVKWESILSWQREIENAKDQLPDEVLHELPESPAVRILNSAEKLEVRQQYAPALQLTRQVLYFANLTNGGELLTKRAQELESQILAGYYTPERLAEAGDKYSKEALDLFASSLGDRALELFGLALYYNPQLPLKNVGNEDFAKLMKLWTKNREERLEADWLFTRSQANYAPSIESKLCWLQRANKLDPHREDIKDDFEKTAREAKPQIVAFFDRAVDRLDIRAAEDTLSLLESISDLQEDKMKSRHEVTDYRAQVAEVNRIAILLEQFQNLGDLDLLAEAENNWSDFQRLAPKIKVPKTLISREMDLLQRLDDLFAEYRSVTEHLRAFQRITVLRKNLQRVVEDDHKNLKPALEELQ